MQNLFNETKSRLFLGLCQIINEVACGTAYTREELIGRFKTCTGFHYDPEDTCNADAIREQELIDTLFLFDPKTKQARLYVSEKIPALPSTLELQWLKSMLLDNDFSWLLPEELRQKLLQRLEGRQPLVPEHLWKRIQQHGDADSAKVKAYLQQLQIGFQQKVKIHYVNEAASGRLYEDTAAPCRLEYDLAANKYALVIWQEKENRAVKLLLSNLQDLQLTNEPIPEDIPKKLDAFYAQPKQTVTLQLTNTVNAVERCFALFAPYDKTSSVDDDLEIYQLEIQYYAFDHDEVIRKILSLGCAVTVLRPAAARAEVRDILLVARQHYL